jgi:hypothetical protein
MVSMMLRFIFLLGSSRGFAAFRLTAEHLSAAPWAALHIASWMMEASRHDAAVRAALVRAIIIRRAIHGVWNAREYGSVAKHGIGVFRASLGGVHLLIA